MTSNNFPDSGIHSSAHGAINSIATGHSWFAFHEKKYWFFGAPSHFFQNGVIAQNCSVRSINCINFYRREEEIRIVVVKEEGLVGDGKRKIFISIGINISKS